MSAENLKPLLKEEGFNNRPQPVMSLSEIIPGIEENFKVHKGKVRDSVDLGDQLLIVATDRISTFDCVHPNGIPGKGEILTQMTVRWLNGLGVPDHLITADIQEFPKTFNNESLRGRSMLVDKLNMIPIECIVRGYITGSAWSEYKKTGAVCGIELPAGLVEAQKLDKPVFTPSTKATSGHDENIDFEKMEVIIEGQFQHVDSHMLSKKIKARSLRIYKTAADYALSRGIIIADTKFEFGLDFHGNLILADEVLTPDSSRFWDARKYTPGKSQQSLDKQYVRDYVASIGWNKKPPAPPLPPEVVERTAQRYEEGFRRIFG